MLRSRAIVVVLAGIAGLLRASTVNAEESDALSRGVELLRSFEYDSAIEHFQSVVDDEMESAANRLHALELIAAVYFNTDRRDEARQTFERLLDADPDHQLRERTFPPPVQEFFAEIRESYEPRDTAMVNVRITELGEDQVRLEAVVLQGPGIDQAVAHVRTRGEASFRDVPLERDGNAFTAELPAPGTDSPLEYYVEMTAPSGRTIVTEGSVDSPLSFEATTFADVDGTDEPIDGGPRRPFYRTWWFWTVIGVVVAGGTAAAIAVPLTAQDDPPTGSLGSGRLE